MEIIFSIYIFVFGLVIGSFLNVVIYRTPLKLSIAKGFSFCPKCNERLTILDLVPLFSYIFLLGKCRYCKEKISIRYPLVESLNALFYLLIYLVYGFSILTPIYFIASSCLISLAFIDFDCKIIPDRFQIIIGICGILLLIFSNNISWLDRVIGLFAISVPFFVIAMFGGMGEGDVKLFAVCGFLIGWKLILLSMLISSIIAAIVGISLIIAKKAEKKSEIPFGPYIALAVLISILAGDNIIKAYLSLIIK